MTYIVLYEFLNSDTNRYQNTHMYVGAGLPADAETVVRDHVRSLHSGEHRIVAVYTPEELRAVREKQEFWRSARHQDPILSTTTGPNIDDYF